MYWRALTVVSHQKRRPQYWSMARDAAVTAEVSTCTSRSLLIPSRDFSVATSTYR
jgi:hypothetical protein